MKVDDLLSYRKLKLQEFNIYDIERTIRENIYELQDENIRIDTLVTDMLNQKLPVPLILSWLRQLENNAAEIVYMTTVVQNDLQSYNFTTSTLYRKSGGN